MKEEDFKSINKLKSLKVFEDQNEFFVFMEEFSEEDISSSKNDFFIIIRKFFAFYFYSSHLKLYQKFVENYDFVKKDHIKRKLFFLTDIELDWAELSLDKVFESMGLPIHKEEDCWLMLGDDEENKKLSKKEVA